MNLIDKLVKADRDRLSRFHTLRGQFVGWSEVALVPLHLVNWFLARAGVFRCLPWIPASARRRLEGLLHPDWTVLECGAGMSTVWWSKRVRRVTSLEENQEWSVKVSGKLARVGAGNVEFLVSADYAVSIRELERSWSLVVVDGGRRDECVAAALKCQPRPHWIYLDNSDRSPTQPAIKRAEELLIGAAALPEHIEYFRGYAPGQLAPTEGMLVRIRKE
jgi:hypothetical protein